MCLPLLAEAGTADPPFLVYIFLRISGFFLQKLSDVCKMFELIVFLDDPARPGAAGLVRKLPQHLPGNTWNSRRRRRTEQEEQERY